MTCISDVTFWHAESYGDAGIEFGEALHECLLAINMHFSFGHVAQEDTSRDSLPLTRLLVNLVLAYTAIQRCIFLQKLAWLELSSHVDSIFHTSAGGSHLSLFLFLIEHD